LGENVMMNAEPEITSQDAAVDAIVQTGARGAVMLSGIATAIVIGLWIAFYLLVFVPRGAGA
jgi:hypothetical protein